MPITFNTYHLPCKIGHGDALLIRFDYFLFSVCLCSRGLFAVSLFRRFVSVVLVPSISIKCHLYVCVTLLLGDLFFFLCRGTLCVSNVITVSCCWNGEKKGIKYWHKYHAEKRTMPCKATRTAQQRVQSRTEFDRFYLHLLVLRKLKSKWIRFMLKQNCVVAEICWKIMKLDTVWVLRTFRRKWFWFST